MAVEPALSDNDWAGAAMGAATGLGQALRGEAVTATAIQPGPPYEPPAEPQPAEGGSSALVWLLVLLIVVAVVILAIWMLVRRARSRPSSGSEARAPPERRRCRSRSCGARPTPPLVETDDAVKTSTQEVGFAVAEFGEEQAAPFSQALAEAQSELDQAFKLRKELDAAAGEGPQRELLTAILQHTGAANAALDAQAERFDKLRDLERNAPEVLAKLEKQLAELEARRPEAERVLAELGEEYAATALAPVAAAPADAGSRMDFAREHVKAGREDLAAGHRGEAAVEALVAEEAAGQAQQLARLCRAPAPGPRGGAGPHRRGGRRDAPRHRRGDGRCRRSASAAGGHRGGGGDGRRRRGRPRGRPRPAGGAPPPQGSRRRARAGARAGPRRAGPARKGRGVAGAHARRRALRGRLRRRLHHDAPRRRGERPPHAPLRGSASTANRPWPSVAPTR